MSDLPSFTMRNLLEAGVHFGHRTLRWNPRMAPYIFGERSGIHIIDLQQTVPLLYRALQAVQETVSRGGRVLFVGTKHQASDLITEAAKRCGQYYVNHRWLGGMLTNWNTVSASIKTLSDLEKQLSDQEVVLSKKERLTLARQKEKIEKSLGGIREMGGLPSILFIIDTNREDIAVKEARRLGIPVVAILDSNSEPDGIAYPVPGNDDSTKAIELYCDLVAKAVIGGLQKEFTAKGGDIGESAVPAQDSAPAEKNTREKATHRRDKSTGKTVEKVGKKDELKKIAEEKAKAKAEGAAEEPSAETKAAAS